MVADIRLRTREWSDVYTGAFTKKGTVPLGGSRRVWRCGWNALDLSSMFKRNHVLAALTVIVGFIMLMVTGTGASAGSSSAILTSPRPSLRSLLISATAVSDVSVFPIQPAIILSGIEQEYQGWNNCGPASLKMNLGYYGLTDTQQEIAAFTKPNPNDTNVNADELVAYANKIGMLGLTRENGTFDRLKHLLSNGLPVIIETGVSQGNTGGWISHDKLLIGYDDEQFIFMDPLDGPDQKVAFEAMDAGWRALNRRYVIVYPSEKEEVVRAIVGSHMDDATMYTNGVARARAEIEANPKDAFAYFNLGTNLNGLQQYQDAAAAFDRARAIGLPWRMMWYQFGPYVAYLLSGRNDDVITLADDTLRTINALEESHYYKGLALSALGQTDEARSALQTALRYNKNHLEAQRALQRLSTSG